MTNQRNIIINNMDETFTTARLNAKRLKMLLKLHHKSVEKY